MRLPLVPSENAEGNAGPDGAAIGQKGTNEGYIHHAVPRQVTGSTALLGIGTFIVGLVAAVASVGGLWLSIINTSWYKRRNVERQSRRVFRVVHVPKSLRIGNSALCFDIIVRKATTIRYLQFDFRHLETRTSVPGEVIHVEPTQIPKKCNGKRRLVWLVWGKCPG